MKPNESTDAKQDSTAQAVEDVVSSITSTADENTGAKDSALNDVVENAAKDAAGESPTLEKEADESLDLKKSETEEKTEEEVNEPKVEEVETPKVDENVVPFHDHPRWKEVTGENVSLKADVERAKPFVDYAERIGQFRHQNNISDEQFNDAMTIMALMNTDPQGALKALKPYIDHLESATGERLPEDLSARVNKAKAKLDNNEIDAETYEDIKLSCAEQARSRAAVTTERLGVQRQQQSAASQQQNAMVNAVNAWDAAKRKSDTDYSPKTSDVVDDGKWEMVRDKLNVLASQSPPRTAAEAVALAEKALSMVNGALKKYVPKSPSKRTLSSNGSLTKKEVEKVPESLDEVLNLAVKKTLAKHAGH